MVDVDKATIARLKKSGSSFEILVSLEDALKLKNGENIAVSEIVAVEKVFSDAKKGLEASEAKLNQAFGTDDFEEVAKSIIKTGELQLTAEHKAKILKEKKKRIIELIHRNAVDPRSGLPHPVSRIELAFEEAKVRIDEHKPEQQQLQEIVKKLRPILPMSFDKLKLSIKVPAEFSAKAYSVVQGFGEKLSESWLQDGSLAVVIEAPAGMKAQIIDQLNSLTKGNVEVKIE